MSVTTAPATASAPIVAKPPRFERLRLLLRQPPAMIGLFIVVFWIVCAIFGDHLTPVDAYADDMLNTLDPPSAEHWFGTDQLGRDVFARVITGARDILKVAPLATILGTVLGTTLGLITGYFRGIVDDVLSRVIDAFLAVPLLLVAMLALVALGPSNSTVVVAIGISFTPLIARTVRAAVLSERSLDYVAAARLRGENARWIMFAEILPNIIPPIFVEMTVRLGYAIFTVATLSFLGLGIQPPSPDWGLAIADNYSLISGGYWWTVLFPALAIATLVVGVNLLADGVQGVMEQ